MLVVSESGALNCYTFFRPILLTLSVFRNPILTHLPLSGSLDSLLCNLIAPTPYLAFFPMMPPTLAAAPSLSSGRAYSSLDLLSPLSLSSLDPYSDYVRVNISQNNSSSLSFVNVYARSICSSPSDCKTDSFSPSIFSSSTNLFILGDFNCHHPSKTQEVLPIFVGRKYSTGSSIPTSSHSMALTYLPFYIAPPLTYPLLPLLSLFLAHGSCFRTWVLITYQFFYLSLSLRSFAPTSVPLPPIFRKMAGMTLLFTSILTVLLQRNTRLFLFPLLLLPLLLWH